MYTLPPHFLDYNSPNAHVHMYNLLVMINYLPCLLTHRNKTMNNMAKRTIKKDVNPREITPRITPKPLTKRKRERHTIIIIKKCFFITCTCIYRQTILLLH